MIGQARDLWTPGDGGKPQTLAIGEFRILASPAREILSIEANTKHPGLPEMVGVKAGGASRLALNEKLGDLRGTPLFQLLDDFAGASLVAGWIWSQWSDDWFARRRESGVRAGGVGPKPNVCLGFAEGASSLESAAGNSAHHSCAEVGLLENPDDPIGWHPMPHQVGPQKRRSRRLDLWREDGLIKIDAAFQDSGPKPDGGRTAIHEYRLFAELDEDDGSLIALQVLPMILPFPECPGAAIKATRMIGQKVSDFRNAVLETLPATMGCTHLNDMLRSLSDVPELADALPK